MFGIFIAFYNNDEAILFLNMYIYHGWRTNPRTNCARLYIYIYIYIYILDYIFFHSTMLQFTQLYE